MRFELLVALRYLTARRRQTIVSVVTLIAVGGVAVGVTALIVAIALMTGFSSDIQSKILGAEAHVFAYGDRLGGGIADWRGLARRLERLPHVAGAAPNVIDTGILEGALDRDRASLRGILPELEGRVSDVREKLVAGSLDALRPVPPGERTPIVLGKDLALHLGVGTGDVVRYFSLSHHRLSPLGPLPRRRAFEVVGVFETGYYDYDRSWALVHLSAAQELLDLGDAVTVVKLRVDRLDAIAGVARAAEEQVERRYLVRDLVSSTPLFSAFKLEKLLMFITIGLIVVVAALNIVTTLTMMVMEKNKDIGILVAMGLTRRRVLRVFMLQGLVIGVIGTALGLAAGVGLSTWLDRFRIISLDTRVYYVPYLPFRVEAADVAVIALLAVAVSFVATFYPAWRAAGLDPVEALRYE